MNYLNITLSIAFIAALIYLVRIKFIIQLFYVVRTLVRPKSFHINRYSKFYERYHKLKTKEERIDAYMKMYEKWSEPNDAYHYNEFAHKHFLLPLQKLQCKIIAYKLGMNIPKNNSRK